MDIRQNPRMSDTSLFDVIDECLRLEGEVKHPLPPRPHPNGLSSEKV